MLTERELRGVMAHELAHVKHRDILISTITATMAGAISMLANFAMFFGGRDSEGRPANPIAGIAVTLLAPLAAGLIQMAISRAREFEADRGGAEISGDPQALASALQKIHRYAHGMPLEAAERNPATAQMMIINPLSRRRPARLFSTHPSTEERVERLLAMAAAGALTGRCAGRATRRSAARPQVRPRARPIYRRTPLDPAMRRTSCPRSSPVAARLLLAGCDMLGIESPEKIAAAREADGKAIGGACRHAGRAIEDCYALYRKADRAAIFAGWRDMNDYMRENKIEPVAPQLAAQAHSGRHRAAAKTALRRRRGTHVAGRRRPQPLHFELADDDALAALALQAQRRALILLRGRRRSRSTATASARCSTSAPAGGGRRSCASTRYLPGFASCSENSSGRSRRWRRA